MKPSYLKTSLYAVATTTLLLFSSQNYAQQYYKWMDANGSTHYTTTPPPKGAKRLDRISTYGEKINSKETAKKSEKNNSPSQNTDEREVTGNSLTILTNNGSLEIPPLKDGESITFNK